MELLPLHQYQEYCDACADVLNEEWPRSKAARLHMLEKSRDALPYSMVFLQNNTVIGHSRLCKVHGVENACFVESVVIKKALRGKGYGRTLMEKTERSAKELGYDTVYLTTHDKQDFYGHLGYEFCDAVVSLGGASTLLSNEQLEQLFGSVYNKNRPIRVGVKSKAQKDAENTLTKTMTNSDSLSNLHELTIDGDLACNENVNAAAEEDEIGDVDLASSEIEDPPPPPPPAPPVSTVVTSTEGGCAPFDKGATPPPPPPPPPAVSARAPTDTVTRFGQGQIFWMKKQL